MDTFGHELMALSHTQHHILTDSAPFLSELLRAVSEVGGLYEIVLPAAKPRCGTAKRRLFLTYVYLAYDNQRLI